MIYLGILIAAALPVILAFVFLELKSEKQEEAEGLERINDTQRKLAKRLGWAIFLSIVILWLIPSSHSRLNLMGLLRFIADALKFLR